MFSIQPDDIVEHYGDETWAFHDKDGGLHRIMTRDRFYLNTQACKYLRAEIGRKLGRNFTQDEVAHEANVRGTNRARQRRYSSYEQKEQPVPLSEGCRIVNYLVRQAHEVGIKVHWEDLVADRVNRTDFVPREGGVVDKARENR